MRLFVLFPTTLLLAATVSPAAAPTDAIKARVAGYKVLGTAFKSVTDAVRGGDVRSPAVKQAAQRIVQSAREQYQWFPQGSVPRAGGKTAAKADIWVRPQEFRAAQDALGRQAGALERAVASGDEGVIRSEARKLGAACKGCHDQFRTSDD